MVSGDLLSGLIGAVLATILNLVYVRRGESYIYVGNKLAASSVGNYTGIKMAGDQMIKL